MVSDITRHWLSFYFFYSMLCSTPPGPPLSHTARGRPHNRQRTHPRRRISRCMVSEDTALFCSSEERREEGQRRVLGCGHSNGGHNDGG